MPKQITLSETQLRNTVYKTIASMLQESYKPYVLHYKMPGKGWETTYIGNPFKLKDTVRNFEYWDVTSGNNTSEVCNLVAWGGKGGYFFNMLNNPQTPENLKQEILSKKKEWGNNIMQESNDMSKKIVKINESVLRGIISEGVKKILKEYNDTIENWWKHNGTFDREQASNIPAGPDTGDYLQKTDEWWQSLSDEEKYRIYNEFFDEV